MADIKTNCRRNYKVAFKCAVYLDISRSKINYREGKRYSLETLFVAIFFKI